jgi:uncharacterized protein YgbK (DUF1537 family)
MALLGAIADDFTGATDLATTLARGGMRTVQLIGAPEERGVPSQADAVVIALKSRTAPPVRAVEQSTAALSWLRHAGARQLLFKYCSTFDSTDRGNIGPVADALLDRLGGDFTVFCPAFPENGRTVYRGYLFVGDVLLSESGMRDHPLTPMRDANLRRVLGRQTPHHVGLVPLEAVRAGAAAVRTEVARPRRGGCRHAFLDAVQDADLLTIGEAVADLSLVTGGSGIALGLPENFRRAGLLDAVVICSPSELREAQARRVIEAGKPVLAELPLAMSYAGGAALAALARRRNVTVMVAHTQRYMPAVRAVRDHVAAGRLHVHHVLARCLFFRRRNVGWTGRIRSRADNVLWHHSCHMVDTCLWILGMPPVDRFAARGRIGPIYPATGIPMGLDISIATPAGRLINIGMSYHSKDTGLDFLFIGEERTLHTAGHSLLHRGTVLYDAAAHHEYVANEPEDREFFAALAGGAAGSRPVRCAARAGGPSAGAGPESRAAMPLCGGRSGGIRRRRVSLSLRCLRVRDRVAPGTPPPDPGAVQPAARRPG